MTFFTQQIRSVLRLGLLALVALALFPPGPSAPAARAQGAPPAAPTAPHQIHLPLLLGGGGAAVPDLIFTPDLVDLAPGAEASITVRVEPAADLTGATFELPGVQDGVTSRFEAAADGMTGTLIVEASTAAADDERALTVQGTSGDGAKGWVGALKIKTQPTLGAKTLFVDPNTGSDTNDGSQAKPLKTLTKALAVAKKGDTDQASRRRVQQGHQRRVVRPTTLAGTSRSNDDWNARSRCKEERPQGGCR